MIHKEGYKIIFISLLILTSMNLAIIYFSNSKILNFAFLFSSIIFFLLITWFFRNPKRNIIQDDITVLSPADGKIVLIEKVFDHEYFKSERLQVSIFMSPLNVHVNYYPIGGTIRYVKYYPGNYLVAWHPKSSDKNGRSVIVIEKDQNKNVLIKQIAGAIARRIVTYSKEGMNIQQGEELGFIKFGSRVDILLPLEAQINVKIGDKVKGNIDQIAVF